MKRFFRLGIGLLALSVVTVQLFGTEPVPLNDHVRLGQRFTAAMPWNGVWVTAPSWCDAEGGFTLTVWDSPDRNEPLAHKVFVDIQDNAKVELWLPQRRNKGIFYWEITERTGNTRVGLYANELKGETDDCAYFDGVLRRDRAFISGPIYCVGRLFDSADEMVRVLTSDADLHDKRDACRQLAAAGDASAIPILAGLLPDPELSHMARYALEPMPDPAVDSVFRNALSALKGNLLIGVINSIGIRRDTEAVGALASLLSSADPGTVQAAAAALGRIGTLDAATELERVLDTIPDTIRPVVSEACLSCACPFAAEGQSGRAAEIFDRLRTPQNPLSIRQAALRGALELGTEHGLPLLLEQLRTPDVCMFDVAMWTLQRGLPGANVTQAVARELTSVSLDRRPGLIYALAGRGDPAALPALTEAAGSTDQSVRLAALQGLPLIGGDAAVQPLVDALADSDSRISETARNALEALPLPTLTQAVNTVLAGSDKGRKLVAMDIARRRKLQGVLPALRTAGSADDPELRTAALNAMRPLAGVAEVPSLIAALRRAENADEAKKAEDALIAASGRGAAEATPYLRAALADGPETILPALLRALESATDKDALEAVVQYLNDPRPPVRDEAIRVLTSWQDRSVLPYLLTLARTSEDMREYVLAVRGLIRLAEAREGKWGADLTVLREVMTLSRRTDEKKAVLGALGKIPDRPALALALRALDTPDLSLEACNAIVTIAEKISRPEDGDVADAMRLVLSRTEDAEIRQRAERILAKHTEHLDQTRKVLSDSLPKEAPVRPLKPRRLLLFDVNVSYGGHPSRFRANTVFTLMGQMTGAYETVLSRDPEIFRPESLRQFDAVCFNNTLGMVFDDPELQQSLVEFVYGGGGLIGIHATTFTFIDWGGTRGDTWPEFGIMLGARGGTHADAREEVRVKIDDPGHPLTAVFKGKDFDYRDEYYRVHEPYSRDRVRVLLSIDAANTDFSSSKLPPACKEKDGDYPLAWVRHYGRGRVFYCTIGHNNYVFEQPDMLAFYLAAIQFALGDLPAPALPSACLTPAEKARETLGWRLGMTAYSLHKYTFFETIDKTAELGLPYINGLCFQKVSDTIPKNFGPDLTIEEQKQIRLKLDSAHVRLLTHYEGRIPGDEKGCRRIFEFARRMGIETLISEPKPEDLDTIERFCNEYDINLGLHNHGPDHSPHYWCPEKILEACKGHSKRIGACVDLGYWMRSGVDPVAGVRTLGNRLITIQVHDLNELTPDGHDVPWGTGAGRLEEILKTMDELQIKPTMFGIEYSYDWLDNMPEMAQCAAFFDRVALQLAR